MCDADAAYCCCCSRLRITLFTAKNMYDASRNARLIVCDYRVSSIHHHPAISFTRFLLSIPRQERNIDNAKKRRHSIDILIPYDIVRFVFVCVTIFLLLRLVVCSVLIHVNIECFCCCCLFVHCHEMKVFITYD